MWLYISAVLLTFRVPQILVFGAEYPFLCHKLHHLYYDVRMAKADLGTFFCGLTWARVEMVNPRGVIIRLGYGGMVCEDVDFRGKNIIRDEIEIYGIWPFEDDDVIYAGPEWKYQ